MNKRKLGKESEEKAVRFLKKKGYRILANNFQNRIAEIDIIAQQGDIMCFIEVKARHTMKYGLPREAITPSKIRKIIKGAQSYINYKGIRNTQFRFDVIEIFLQDNRINHIEDAFSV
ncbi:MAG: Endonuclease [Clostridiales bacterium 38_11]|nr:MAG: Endonuclease [Clostridiales bacterium 38_11]HBH11523.1 YraN family protein [Clostridiales bacterium]